MGHRLCLFLSVPDPLSEGKPGGGKVGEEQNLPRLPSPLRNTHTHAHARPLPPLGL